MDVWIQTLSKGKGLAFLPCHLFFFTQNRGGGGWPPLPRSATDVVG